MAVVGSGRFGNGKRKQSAPVQRLEKEFKKLRRSWLRRTALSALFLVPAMSLVGWAAGQRDAAEYLLRCKSENLAIILSAVISLAILATMNWLRAYFIHSNNAHAKTKFPSYSGVAACFFVAPSGCCCLGYLLSLNAGVDLKHLSDGLLICSTFIVWLFIIMLVRWYALRRQLAAMMRVEAWTEESSSILTQMHFLLLGLFIATIAFGCCLMKMIRAPEHADLPGVVALAGLVGVASAVETWWKVVIFQQDSETIEPRGVD